MDSEGTQILEAVMAFKALRHSKGTWALRQSRHSGTWALESLGHSRHLDTWSLRYLGTGALEKHLGTWALRYLGAWALEALVVLYLADPFRLKLFYTFNPTTKHLEQRNKTIVKLNFDICFCIFIDC